MAEGRNKRNLIGQDDNHAAAAHGKRSRDAADDQSGIAFVSGVLEAKCGVAMRFVVCNKGLASAE
jgi:hypothetical protein